MSYRLACCSGFLSALRTVYHFPDGWGNHENSSTEYTKPPPLIPTPRHLFAYVTWRAIIPHDGYGATVGRDKRGCGRSSFALGETAEPRELRRRRFVGRMHKAFVRRDAELDMADFPRLGVCLDHPARHRVAWPFVRRDRLRHEHVKRAVLDIRRLNLQINCFLVQLANRLSFLLAPHAE